MLLEAQGEAAAVFSLMPSAVLVYRHCFGQSTNPKCSQRVKSTVPRSCGARSATSGPLLRVSRPNKPGELRPRKCQTCVSSFNAQQGNSYWTAYHAAFPEMQQGTPEASHHAAAVRAAAQMTANPEQHDEQIAAPLRRTIDRQPWHRWQQSQRSTTDIEQQHRWQQPKVFAGQQPCKLACSHSVKWNNEWLA